MRWKKFGKKRKELRVKNIDHLLFTNYHLKSRILMSNPTYKPELVLISASDNRAYEIRKIKNDNTILK